jgi:hypothetical protein
MAKSEPFPDPEKPRPEALARWENEGGAEPCGPQVPGVAKDCSDTPSEPIDAEIAALGDWRGATLARLRALIREADPEVAETVKWRKPSNPAGVPVWEHEGIVCTGETYRDKVKLTFARGAALKDPAGLFNSSLDGNMRRAIDLRQGEAVDGAAFKALVRAAVAANLERLPRK